MSKTVTFEEARASARAEAMAMLKELFSGKLEDILEERVVETEHCWMFFRKRSIILPPEYSLRDCSYVMAKRGGGRLVPDYWDDEVRLQEYLKTISDYLATHDAETGQQHV